MAKHGDSPEIYHNSNMYSKGLNNAMTADQDTLKLTPLRIALIYAVFGICWVLFSDLLVAHLVFSAELYTMLSIIKGWLFIVVTTLLLVLLMKRYEAGRQSAEKALLTSNESLHLALSSMKQGFYDFNIQTDAVHVNPEYSSMLGYGPGELRITREWWAGELHPADRAYVREMLNRCFIGKITSYTLEFRIRTKSGDWKWIHSMGTVVEYDNNGKPLRLVGTHTDITERKNAEATLREREAQYRTLSQRFNVILDMIPDVVTLLDTDLKIIWINRSAGKTVEEVIGEYCYKVCLDAPVPCVPCPVRESIRTGLPAAQTKTSDAGIIWDVRTVPIKDDKGHVISVVELSRNITEHRKLEEQLLHVQKMEAIGQIAGGVAHDFNNMLSAMLGFSSLIQMKMKPDDPSQHYLEEINKLVDRGANLTRSLLAFSRKQVLAMKPASLNAIINSIGKLLLRVIGADIQLSIHLPGKDSIVLADSSQLDQILLNLATNARDAMPNGGRLSISLDNLIMDDEYIRIHGYGEPGPYAVISVQDSGTGIDETVRDKIFEPFFTTKEIGKGTGLGLAIVYGLVKQHNGYIDVYSESGYGTTFKILLPIIDSPAADSVDAHTMPAARGSATILLVEDDLAVRTGIKIFLAELGYKVLEAVNGINAVEEYSKHSKDIDMVIMDIIMPVMSGKEAFDEIIRIRPDAKVLFMSGYTADFMKTKVGMEDSMHFLTKPIAPRELLNKINEMLGK